MANWANVCYYIEGDRSTLETIKKAIEDNETGKHTYDESDLIQQVFHFKTERYLRGAITMVEFRDDALYLEAEEAWGRSDFSECLKEVFPDVNIYWFVEEWGNDIYETNDVQRRYFTEKVYVDYEKGTSMGREYFDSEEGAMIFIRDTLGLNGMDAVKQFNNNSNGTEEHIDIRVVDYAA